MTAETSGLGPQAPRLRRPRLSTGPATVTPNPSDLRQRVKPMVPRANRLYVKELGELFGGDFSLARDRPHSFQLS